MGGGRRACSKAGGEGSRGDRCVPEEALSASITSNDWGYHQLNPKSQDSLLGFTERNPTFKSKIQCHDHPV